MSLKSYLADIQKRPYEERVRFLLISTAVCGIILIAIFTALYKVSLNQPTNNTENPIVKTLSESLANSGPEITNVKNQVMAQFSGLNLPADYRAVSVTTTHADNNNNQLVVEFTVENPSYDTLNIFAKDYSNLSLQDGDKQLKPLAVITDNALPFPLKILGKMNFSGKIYFAKPQSQTVTLKIADLSFESQATEKFSENLDISLGDGEVKGASNLTLPRQ